MINEKRIISSDFKLGMLKNWKGTNGMKKGLIGILFTFILLACTNVYAATAEIDLNKDVYDKGEEISAKIKLKDLTEEIYGLSGIITYNSSIISEYESDEAGNSESVVSLNENGVVKYNKLNKTFLYLSTKPIKSETEIIELKFKINENTLIQNTELKLENILASDSMQDINIGGATAQIEIKQSNMQQPTSTPTISPTQTPIATPTGMPTTMPTVVPTEVPTSAPVSSITLKQNGASTQTQSQSINNKGNIVDNLANITIPYTGIKISALIPIAIGVLLINIAIKIYKYKTVTRRRD